MSYGNLLARSDLSPIFGAMPLGEQCSRIEELLRINDRLKLLAREAAELMGEGKPGSRATEMNGNHTAFSTPPRKNGCGYSAIGSRPLME